MWKNDARKPPPESASPTFPIEAERSAESWSPTSSVSTAFAASGDPSTAARRRASEANWRALLSYTHGDINAFAAAARRSCSRARSYWPRPKYPSARVSTRHHSAGAEMGAPTREVKPDTIVRRIASALARRALTYSVVSLSPAASRSSAAASRSRTNAALIPVYPSSGNDPRPRRSPASKPRR